VTCTCVSKNEEHSRSFAGRIFKEYRNYKTVEMYFYIQGVVLEQFLKSLAILNDIFLEIQVIREL